MAAPFLKSISAAATVSDRVRAAWAELSGLGQQHPNLSSILDFPVDDAVAAEAIVADAEERWARSLPASLEHYQQALPELADRPRTRRALLMCELCRRMEADGPTLRAELVSRFPTLADDIDSVLSLMSFARDAAGDEQGPAEDATGPPAAGTQLGKYTLVRPLGKGSYGQVWLAHDRLLRRHIALKLLDAPAGGAGSVLAEARAAAALDHPGIIAVYDAGAWPDAGLLYIDQQLASDGGEQDDQVAVALDRVVEQQGPFAPRRAAATVESIARAVAHAHARGILHRDIKPANILLTPSGRALITDFGLAAAMDSLSGGRGRVAGTPAYMSPQQASGESSTPLDDVFGLGAVLRYVLTARHPRSPRPGAVDATADVLAQARNEALPRVEQLSPGGSGIPRTLAAIANRATEFEPTDRYLSADQLAADLRAWLGRRPTVARPPSPPMAGGLFLRRHAAISAVAIGALTLLTAGTAHHLRRVASERDTAQRNLQDAIEARAESQRSLKDAIAARDTASAGLAFIQEILSASVPGAQVANKDRRVSDVLAVAARRAPRLADRPLVEAAVRHTIGSTYLMLSRPADAQPHIERALSLRRKHLGQDNADTILTWRSYAALLHQRGRTQDAISELSQARDAAVRTIGPDARETCTIINTLGSLYESIGNLDAAEECQRRALEGRLRTLGEHNLETLGSRRAVATLLLTRADRPEMVDESIRELREIIASLEAHPATEGGGPDGFFAALTNQDLGAALRKRGRPDEAQAVLEPAIERLRIVAGPEHQITLTAEINLAAVLFHDRHDPTAALPLYEHAAETTARIFTPDHPSAIIYRRAYGECLAALHQTESARRTLQLALDSAQRTFGPDHAETQTLVRLLASLSNP